jgi:hypothetical protein
MASVARRMQQLAGERERTIEEQKREAGNGDSVYHVPDFSFPNELNSAEQLDGIIRRLQELKAKFATYTRIVFGNVSG